MFNRFVFSIDFLLELFYLFLETFDFDLILTRNLIAF